MTSHEDADDRGAGPARATAPGRRARRGPQERAADEPDESCFDPATHRPRLLSRQCATCILRPGNPMHLAPGRLKDMVAGALQEGCQGIICHDTLSYGPHPGFAGAMCRGFYDQYGPRSNFVRVIERIGGFTEVDLPGEAPDQAREAAPGPAAGGLEAGAGEEEDARGL